MRWNADVSLLALVVLGLSSQGAHAKSKGDECAGRKKPNFVYILADDQDAATCTPEIMPHTYKLLAQHGVNYTNFFTPVSQCCPSRVGFLRGQHGHSHNITSVSAPLGGYEVFCKFGYNRDNIFTWLQSAGYQTYYTGKLMNGNNIDNAEDLPVAGLNQSAILLDPFTYTYCNASYTINGGPAQQYPNVYSTDWIRDRGVSYLEEAAKHDQPFFIGVAPIGPHSDAPASPNWRPPVWPSRFDNMFNEEVAPRRSSFNPETPSGASWVSKLERLNSTEVDYLDEYYRARLRALQANDELVAAIYQKLESLGFADNTYVIYTADNGYTLGAHRRQPGKTTGYEEDIRVPFIVRGPGISAGKDTLSAHSNIDITATLVSLSGAEVFHELDGRVMPWGNQYARQSDKGTVSHQLSEFWVGGGGEGKYASTPAFAQKGPYITNALYPNNTYRALRVVEEGQNWAYAVWCTGERELYNMTSDSDQMNNLLSETNANGAFADLDTSTIAGQIAVRLDAIMLYLKYCHGIRCRYSWSNLFPYGEANTLTEALKPEFDEYFAALPKVHYRDCKVGFHLENEFPYWTTDLAYSGDPYLNRPANSSSGGGGRAAKQRRMWDWSGVHEWPEL